MEEKRIHPSAIISKTAQIKQRSIIAAGVILGDDVIVEEACYLGTGVIVEKKTRIEKCSQIEAGAIIGESVSIGENSRIGMGVKIFKGVRIAPNSVIKIGEIILKDMVYKMVFKRGAWIYREDALMKEEEKNE